MSLWLNWKERLTSNQKVAGSSPAKDFKTYLYIMKKLRGGNIVGSIIGGIIKFVVYTVLTLCVLLFMILAIAIISVLVGVYIFLQKTLEVINIVTGGLTDAINPIFSGISKAFSFIKDLPKMISALIKGKKYKPGSSSSTNFQIPKIPTKPEEIIYAALGIPPQETATNEDEEEDDEEYCPAN
jgi:hypothetical protein